MFRYSVVTSTADELHMERVSLNGALEESIAGFYAALNERGITPVIVLPETPVYRIADKEALERVFGNILNNALKYSDGDLEITLSEGGRLSFSNAASGLDAVSSGKLFERFYTVESARGSTGLGLSIAKLLTEKMGGSIGTDYQNGMLNITLQF